MMHTHGWTRLTFVSQSGDRSNCGQHTVCGARPEIAYREYKSHQAAQHCQEQTPTTRCCIALMVSGMLIVIIGPLAFKPVLANPV